MKKIKIGFYILLSLIVIATGVIFINSNTYAAEFTNQVANYEETYNGETAWWYHNSNGDIDTSVTTVAYNKNGWWYVRNGKVDFSYNGLADNQYGTWYCEGGQVKFNKYDVIYCPYNGTYAWWNVRASHLEKGPTVADNCYGWWYIDKYGKVDFSYNGLADNQYGTWYCEGGQVKFNKYDVVYCPYNGTYAWWNVRESHLEKGPTVANNCYGWWYIDKYGKVDFSYTGLARNMYGLWYCQGGCVGWGYTGKYTLYAASNYGYDSSTKVQINDANATEFTRVFVGDSRTGCLSWVGDSDDGFICKWGMEYDYFVNTEIPELENLIQLMPNIKYVEINMGANDILHGSNLSASEVKAIAAKYTSKVNELVKKYPNIKFYYASVFYTEVSNEYAETVTAASVNKCNADIDIFNAYIKANCKATYIPLREYISSNNIKTADGLHIFDANTLKQLRNYMAGLMK